MSSQTITDITGVFASGISAGIKKSGAKDLAYIYLPQCHASAGVFTRNHWAAPCVHYSRSCLAQGTIKAVIVNSGNANAATGKEGAEDVLTTARTAAELLRLKPEEVAIASTGVIGKRLPMDRIISGLKTLLADPYQRNGQAAVEGIMTTDKFPKTTFREAVVGKNSIAIGGMTKGCGMIAPNMATNLSFLATDARIDQSILQTLLRQAVDETFNMTSVDTDTSTNDMLFLFSTGEKHIDQDNARELADFTKALTVACENLAVQLVKDGEGATKVIEVRVLGAASTRDARTIARDIANSPLVKTAVYGEDPNWGRVIMAVGKNPENTLDLTKFELYFGDTQIMHNGSPLPIDRDQVRPELQRDYVTITVKLNVGSAEAKAWGCDLTHGYIDINTQYS